MNPPDGREGDAGAARRVLVIDLDELCWALNSRDPPGQSSHWLNLESGELLFMAEADALADHPAQREAWFAFERQAMQAIARRWCEDNGITPTWVTHRQPPSC